MGLGLGLGLGDVVRYVTEDDPCDASSSASPLGKIGSGRGSVLCTWLGVGLGLRLGTGAGAGLGLRLESESG